MNASLNPAPVLAPPGAGLPKLELFIARLLSAWRRWRGTRAGFTALFEKERDTILALVGSLSPEKAAPRVLIPRPRGLEDSSRHWSVWMTLDHLRIVNTACTGIIALLAQGQAPDRVASTAAVKPNPHVGVEVVDAFKASCFQLLATAAGIPDLHTRTRFAHPWFGPLDAAGWHAMAGTHMGLHRGQISQIIAGL
jgi:hypothetical protein